MDSFVSLFQAAVAFGTVIMFGALGETLTEKGGNLNLGVPGIMYLGAIASLTASFLYENAVANANPAVCLILALGAGFVAASLSGLLYSFLTVTLRANQNVTGLALTIFGSGVANFFGGSLNKMAGGVGQISVAATSQVFRANPASVLQAGYVGKILLSYGFMVYLAILLALAMQFFFDRTRAGLNLRAVGESPATADAAGINVTRAKYLSASLGAGVAGLGGIYYVMDYIKGTWANDGSIERLGWLAVALVIFTMWKPKNSIWGGYMFGILYWAYFYISGLNRSTQEIFKMLPYIATILVLILISVRKKKENQSPASLGLSYFREER